MMSGDAECYFSACEKCLSDQKVKDQLTATEDELILQIRVEHKAEPKKISAIKNQHNCCICDQPIPDGFKVFVATHMYDRTYNGVAKPEKATYNIATCTDCANQHDIKKKIISTLDDLIPRWRRAAFKTV